MYSPRRQYRIFRITHTASKHFYLSVTVSREQSLNTYVNRFNDMREWGPLRKYQNAALMWFCRKYGPFNNTDFTMQIEEGEYGQQYKALQAAGILAHKLGTELLLSSRIINRRNWLLHEKAIIELSPEGKLKSGMRATPSQLERRGHLEIESHPIQPQLELWQLLHMPKSNHSHPIMLTKLREQQFDRCIAAKHACVAVLKVELPVRMKFGEQMRRFALIHFGPTISDTLRELEELAQVIIHEHTPETEYSLYE